MKSYLPTLLRAAGFRLPGGCYLPKPPILLCRTLQAQTNSDQLEHVAPRTSG